MTEPIMISIDAMGGDFAPNMVIEGCAIALRRSPALRLLLHGDEAKIQPLLEAHPIVAERSELRHTSEAVTPDAKPSMALRRGRNTSMRLDINAVKDGEAQGVVSAGNTGALMAMAKFVLRTLPGVDRPAIASMMPSQKRDLVMLDLGANIDCDERNLVEFAIMGEAFARTVLGYKKPRIGLLNVGAEDEKGNYTVKAAAQILQDQNLPIEFRGFVEGNDIGKGTVDVVVTDGFTGNVALKTIEGTAQFMGSLIKDSLTQGSWLAKLGYLLARGAFKQMRTRTDPRRYNGGMFLGLNGIVVKSHGGTDALGFASALEVAEKMIKDRIDEKIIEDLSKLDLLSTDTSGGGSEAAAG